MTFYISQDHYRLGSMRLNAEDRLNPKGISEFLFFLHFLDKNDRIIFSLPSTVILRHIVVDSSAGIIPRYLVNSFDTVPHPPTTTGITIHSQFHIFASSTR